MANKTGTLQKFKGNIDRMFDKTLTDLVRGIRNNKENEVCDHLPYISIYMLYISNDFYCLSLSHRNGDR